jgi:hypothetical protein
VTGAPAMLTSNPPSKEIERRAIVLKPSSACAALISRLLAALAEYWSVLTPGF